MKHALALNVSNAFVFVGAAVLSLLRGLSVCMA
jgi:hypothetical protein